MSTGFAWSPGASTASPSLAMSQSNDAAFELPRLRSSFSIVGIHTPAVTSRHWHLIIVGRMVRVTMDTPAVWPLILFSSFSADNTECSYQNFSTSSFALTNHSIAIPYSPHSAQGMSVSTLFKYDTLSGLTSRADLPVQTFSGFERH